MNEYFYYEKDEWIFKRTSAGIITYRNRDCPNCDSKAISRFDSIVHDLNNNRCIRIAKEPANDICKEWYRGKKVT